MRLLILLILATCQAGCASVISNSTYPVSFDSNPPGGMLDIRNSDGQSLFKGPGPTTLTLSASDGYFQRASYEVRASMPGYNPGQTTIHAGLDGWYLGNLIFGGLIGILIVDPATGAMWSLDPRAVVQLGAAESAEVDGSVGDSVGELSSAGGSPGR